MTNKEKQLLLQDLCARLPYGVKVCVGTQYDIDNDITDIALLQGLEFDNPIFGVKVLVCAKTCSGSNTFGTDIEEIKPYLRPMSSMTEEEKLELLEVIVGKDAIKYFQVLPDGSIDNTDAAYQDLNNFTIHWINFNVVNITFYLDWLNKKKFDYRGLIPMGLALPAPEGMYNFK